MSMIPACTSGGADFKIFQVSGYEGRIIETGAPDQFFANPRSERTKAFLSKILTH
ncbi:MAG: hypothetical protein HYT86_01550 [candidate division NC10 bacterium]|nr:hypothetical protein [candidate division NC10 bacterium]